MAKIKFRKSTNNEINRVVKNFNQKIKRLEKLNNNLELPQKVSKKDLINVSSSGELQRKLNELRRFSRRGVEESIKLITGESISRYEQKEAGIKLRVAKAKLTRKIKQLENIKPKVAGKVQSVTFAQMGDSAYLKLVAERDRLRSKNINLMSKQEIRALKDMTNKILKNNSKQFRDNYKKMISDIAFMGKYDKEKMNKMMNRIDKLSDSGFTRLFNEDKIFQEIIYRYDSIKADNMMDFSLDNNMLFDEIYENIDTILNDYQ